MSEDFTFRFVGQRGPVISIAVSNKHGRIFGVGGAVLICDFIHIPKQWLFAVPLAAVNPSKVMSDRLCILDFVLLGHPLDSQSTFSIPATLDDMIDQVRRNVRRSQAAQPDQEQAIRQASLGLLASLPVLSQIVPGEADPLLPARHLFLPQIELRLVDVDAKITEINIPLSVDILTGVLANYVTDAVEKEIADLGSALKAAA
jgi:hypothetical protein